MNTLNLGAGNRIVAGAVNHDLVKHRPEIDVVWDLNTIPWPWFDDSFDTIQARSVFEHLKLTLIESCDECWRILRTGGQLILLYPIYSGLTVADDPTHRWSWSEHVIDYLDPETRYGKDYNYYTPRKWKIMSVGVVKDRNVKAVLAVRK